MSAMPSPIAEALPVLSVVLISTAAIIICMFVVVAASLWRQKP